MASLYEFIIWGSIGISMAVGLIASLRSFFKTSFMTYLFLAATNGSVMWIGFMYFFGRLLDAPVLCAIGVIFLAIGFGFAIHFFRSVFGTVRNHEFTEIIAWICTGMIIVDLILEPPVILADSIEYGRLENIGIVGNLLATVVISGDYARYSIKKVIREQLHKKLLVFIVTFIIGILLTLIFFILRIAHILPYAMPFIPITCTLIVCAFITAALPSINFLTPISPKLVLVINPAGITIYSKKLSFLANEDLLSGAVAAINGVFKESLSSSTDIEQLIMKGFHAYMQYRESFFFIFLDETYSPIVEKAFKRFADAVDEQFGSISKNWDGNLEKFDGIENLFNIHFYFLPQLVK